MHAFCSNGVNKMHLPLAVETSPVLIHISLFLFFAGIVIFLFDINHGINYPLALAASQCVSAPLIAVSLPDVRSPLVPPEEMDFDSLVNMIDQSWRPHEL